MQVPLNFAIGVDILKKGLNINWYKENSNETTIFLMNSRTSVKVASVMEDVGTNKLGYNLNNHDFRFRLLH